MTTNQNSNIKISTSNAIPSWNNVCTISDSSLEPFTVTSYGTTKTYPEYTFTTSTFSDVQTSIKKIIAENQDNSLKNTKIIKVEVLCPDKVLRFTFDDGSIIKTICTENDIFDFELAFYIAFAKKEFGHIYTAEGIYHKAKEMQYMKQYVKKVNAAIKVYLKSVKEKNKEEELKKEQKRIKANKNRKKKIQQIKARENRIEEMVEAIRRANSLEYKIKEIKGK